MTCCFGRFSSYTGVQLLCWTEVLRGLGVFLVADVKSVLHLFVGIVGPWLLRNPRSIWLKTYLGLLALVLIFEVSLLVFQTMFPSRFGYCDILRHPGACFPMTSDFYWMLFLPTQIVWCFVVVWLMFNVQSLLTQTDKEDAFLNV